MKKIYHICYWIGKNKTEGINIEAKSIADAIEQWRHATDMHEQRIVYVHPKVGFDPKKFFS